MKCLNFANRQARAAPTERELANKFMEVWLQVATAVAASSNSTQSAAAIRWADTITEAYSARWAEIIQRTNQ